ncbi:MAG: DUF4268 domain-containing protein [bacterium]|nr:DUF4268 domain-containing protein [bacterium]
MPVRRVWAHEEYEFTPWLAENLHLLGETLGLSLELVGREQPVGPYSLDILAKETGAGVFVAIENQLEWADTHHLGQLLIYTAGRDTRIGIWVATGFGYEHAQVLHWLNQSTAGEVGFYAVKVEAVCPSADSEPGARFHKVVWPGGWDKGATPESGPPGGVEYELFFRPLVSELMRAGFSDRQPFRRFGVSDRSFHSRMNPGIQYSVSLEGVNDAWVTLRIQTGNKALTRRVFDALNTDREQIEKAYDADPEPKWYWNGKNRYGWCSISIRTQGSVHDPQTRLEETRQWMLDHLPRFKDFFDPRVNGILQQPQQPTPTND